MIVALAVVLSGCAAAQNPSSASRSPSASSSLSARPTTTASVRPDLAFDGKCESALTDSDVSKAVGATVHLMPPDADAMTWSVQQLGGIACRWADPSNAPLFWMTIIPAAAAGAQVAKQDAEQPYCYGGNVAAGEQDSCSFGVVVGLWWFSGVAYTAKNSYLHSTTAIDQLTAALTPRLPAATAPVPAASSARWSTNLDCSSVATRADVGSALHDQTLMVNPGNGPAEAGPGVYGAMAASGYLSCAWNTDGTNSVHAFTIKVLPGAAWVLDHGGVTSGSPVDMAGVSAALSVPNSSGAEPGLYVSDGTNLMIIEPNNVGTDVMTFAPVVKPLLAALAG